MEMIRVTGAAAHLLLSVCLVGCVPNETTDANGLGGISGTGGVTGVPTASGGAPYSSTVPTAGATSPNVGTGGDTSDASGGGTYPISFATWPSDSTVTFACAKDTFGQNMSALAYEPATSTSPATLWALQNEPSKLHRLTWDGTSFVRVTTDAWVTGKSLRYPDGTGDPDSEGMTLTDGSKPEVYVVAERDNGRKTVPRQSILRFELTGTKGVFIATHEWDLTADLPTFESNSGLEGITWVPDSYLVSKGFIDDSKGGLYDPATYPNHGTGLFLVGIDATGVIFAYVLDHLSNTFTRVATWKSGQSHSVDLFFDRDTGTLWSLCDSACSDRSALFDVETDTASERFGHFVLRAVVPAPSAIKNMNNEGLAIAPAAECQNDRRAIYWTDDDNTGGYALRKGSINCGRLY